MITIASHNGTAAAARAHALLQQGTGPLEACVEGVTLIEDDPEELTVGYGGLPNEQGVVELDAAVMDGRTRRGAGVAALRGVRHPSRVARKLLEQSGRVLLVGEGAREFALANGFPEEDLLTDRARRMWHYWRRRQGSREDWLPPEDDPELDLAAWYERHFYGGGTVHCAALSANGDLACVTSTSGHAFKIAGRVGDSPILGAGLYAENEAGSCGSIGHGEANLRNLSSFLAVEFMRGGRSPEEAGMATLARIAERLPHHEQDAHGRPKFNLQLFLLAPDGTHAGVAMRGPKQYAVCDAAGPRLLPCRALFNPS